MGGPDLRRAAELANRSFLHSGVTFTVYSRTRAPSGSCRSTRSRASSRRTIGRSSSGPAAARPGAQCFVPDVYDGRASSTTESCRGDLVLGGLPARNARHHAPDDHYVHVAGIDVIRRRDGRWLVLEDNLRTPSGVSYVLENRLIMKRTFPDWFADLSSGPSTRTRVARDALVGLSPCRAVTRAQTLQPWSC